MNLFARCLKLLATIFLKKQKITLRRRQGNVNMEAHDFYYSQLGALYRRRQIANFKIKGVWCWNIYQMQATFLNVGVLSCLQTILLSTTLKSCIDHENSKTFSCSLWSPLAPKLLLAFSNWHSNLNVMVVYQLSKIIKMEYHHKHMSIHFNYIR